MTSADMAREESRTACKICGDRSELFDAAIVLRKYSVSYYRCTACGFLQTETPYWLEEAYSAAITRLDVGILQRNLLNREISAAVLNLTRLPVERAVDFGAGHGIFVRLMRDRGFDFRWYDLYASNDYARGFEHQEGSTYDFCTAFELLEHLTDPIADISRIMELSPNLLVSTSLIPQLPLRISDWWYYGPTTGQHISLYTLESLKRIAKHFGRFLLSNGDYHLFTETPLSSFRFALATNLRTARLFNLLRHRKSLLGADFEQMAG